MKKAIILILTMGALWACDKAPDQIEAKVQNIAKPTVADMAADQRKADMAMPSLIPQNTEMKAAAVEKARQQLKDHPLINLIKPENQRIIRFIGLINLDYDCRSEKPRLAGSCDRLISDAIQKMKTAGINVTAEDIKNPAFIDLLTAATQLWKDEAIGRQAKDSIQFEERCRKQLELFKKGELK